MITIYFLKNIDFNYQLRTKMKNKSNFIFNDNNYQFYLILRITWLRFRLYFVNKFNWKKMEKKKDKKLNSKEIFENTTTITIVHDGQEYQLRITKANKLILTK